jgi:4-hydroxy-tetrahydrodipicolinate synthase
MTWMPEGVIGGAITPMTNDDTIDWASLERHLHHLAGSGLSGLLINASMAEGGHLTAGERDEILTFALREVGERLTILATVYGANTNVAAYEAGRAAAAGAQGLLVFPHPAFGGEPLDPEIPAAYFTAIWDAARLPMIVFRTPASLAPTLDLDALKHLADVPGVVAVKDSTGDLAFYSPGGGGHEFMAADSPLKVLVDYDPRILDFLRAGAHGATVISSVVDPQRYVELFQNRHSTEADWLEDQLVIFAEAVYEPPFRNFRARLKEALRADGVIATSHVRRPLAPLTEAERDRVINALVATRELAPRTQGF